jgi:polysaccharide export outer membrane protein
MAANVLNRVELVHVMTGLRASQMFKSLCFVVVLTSTAFPQAAPVQDKGPAPAQLIQYVRDAKKAGMTDAEVERGAIAAGWTSAMIKDAIASSAAPNGGSMPASASGPAATTLAAKPDSVSNAATSAHSNAASNASGPSAPPTDPLAMAKDPSGPKPSESPNVPATAARPPSRHNVPNEYVIGEGDVISVNVWGERDASIGPTVVRTDGMITMPLIKDIRVAGMTPAEAEKFIAEPLSKMITAADVTVIVNSTNSKKIFVVGGGVKKEGPIQYTYRMNVMQAISEAGGLSDYAKKKKIYVLRSENGRQFKLAVNYDALLNGQHIESNHELLPGDTLVVPNH